MRKKIINIILLNAKLFGILLFLLLSLTSYTQTIYAIVVAGTNMPDAVLSEGLTKSFKNIDHELELIPQYTNLKLKKYYLTGSDFSGNKLRNTIRNIHCTGNDVIFFYYLGHGFRYNNQTNQWPNIFVGYNNNITNSQLRNTSIPFQWIINQLNSKGARLTITIDESCNSKINIPTPVEKEIKGLGSLALNIRNPERYKELFEYSKGTISASSSKPGQTSVVSSDDGGYFTESFLEELKEQTAISSSADWRTLLEKTKERTATLTKISRIFDAKIPLQEPQFVINITGGNRPANNWNGIISSSSNVFQQQPANFQYDNVYRPQHFVVARIVNFHNNGVFFLMSDNYIVKYNPYTGGLNMIGYRAASMQPQIFQWDFVNPISPYQTDVFGVDYQGFVWQFNNFYGWQRVGAVYY